MHMSSFWPCESQPLLINGAESRTSATHCSSSFCIVLLMSNNFQRSPEQFRGVKGGNVPVHRESTKLCDNRLDTPRLVHTEVKKYVYVCVNVYVCVRRCVPAFVYVCKKVKVWTTGVEGWGEVCSWSSCLWVSVMPSLDHWGIDRDFQTSMGNDGVRSTPLPVHLSPVPLWFSGGTARLSNVGPSLEVTLAPGWRGW